MILKGHGMLEIHIAVLLFGLSGLFGKLLSLPPLVIVCGRTLFASLALGIILYSSKTQIRTKSTQDLVVLALLGVILAVHWITFFQSIQMSTVAVGLLTFSTFPLFVTFMEPYFFREKLFVFDMFVAGAVLMGVILIVPSFDFNNHVTQGVFWGIMSGFTFAVLSILNRKYVSTYPSMVIVFYQNLVATIILIPFLLYKPLDLQPSDYVLLAILGVFCTALAHVLFIQSLVKIKAQLASVIASLEPVYGIIFAFVILGEVPASRTIVGGFIILGTIILATWKKTHKPANVKSN